MNPFVQARRIGLSSPSNLVVAILLGFLLLGYCTDWKAVYGSKPRPRLAGRGVTHVPVIGRDSQVRMVQGESLAQTTGKPEPTERDLD